MTDTPAAKFELPVHQRVFIDADTVAALCSVSKSHLWDMVREKLIPPPQKLSGASRWRLAELKAWSAAGCPRVDDDSWRGFEWQPTVFASLGSLIKLKKEEITALSEQVREMERRIAAGEPAAGMVPVTFKGAV